MPIVYRNNGDWGVGKGSNLTSMEVDENFWNHEERIVELETNPPEPNEISNITLVGTQLTFYLEDATVFGPYTVPQVNFRPSIVATVSTATYDPVIADANCYKRCTNAAGCLVTIPSDDEVEFSIDTELGFRQTTETGPVTFDAPTDVTLHEVPGFLHETAQKGAVVVWKKVAANEWEATGWLAEDVTA